MKNLITLMMALLVTNTALTAEQKDTLFLELTDSTLMVVPGEYIEEQQEDNDFLTLKLVGDTTIVVAKPHILERRSTYGMALPGFTSFKFNNKFNDQLFTDAIGTIDSINGKVTVQVGCIGKRLTPSFQVPDSARVYLNGERQYSKKTRLRFDTLKHYTVAYPKQYIYSYKKIKDEVWSDPEEEDPEKKWMSTKVELTADMFSTNANSNYGEDPENLLDGNTQTFFHSTWGSGVYTPLAWFAGSTYGDGYTEWPYLQIDLPEPLYRLKLSYITRNSNNRCPTAFILQASEDGNEWTDIRTFTAFDDNLPTTGNAEYLSPVVELGSTKYNHLRIQLTEAQYKNYLVMSEFSLYKMEEDPDYQPEVEPELLEPAEYQRGFLPFGREYDVDVDFLTDHPTSEYNVPRIDIWFDDGVTWDYDVWIGRNGKTVYEDAIIKINGAGVYPDMDSTAVQIRGRGNTSWSGSYTSKNPYRLKFEEKMKPFGMTKGKSWVLLSNKQAGSMTTNAIAMKIADMVGTDGCNHIVPCDLYINGSYRGSYNFTEKVGFSNNSIDLDDESNAVLLEMDSYYDEAYKFRDATYNLYVNIKEPDFSDAETVTNLTMQDIQYNFNYFTTCVKEDGATNMFDVESFVKAMLVTDLTRNQELKHPKSWFIYNANINDSLYHFGPVWDFDWSYGYDGTKTYYVNSAESDLFSGMSSSNIGYPFFLRMLRGTETVKKAYYRLWTDFMESGKLDELIEYCDDYQTYVNPSFLHNYEGESTPSPYDEDDWWGGYYYTKGWGDGNNYEAINENAKTWLRKRANYIYKKLEKFDLSDEIVEKDTEIDYEQPDHIDMAKELNRPVNVFTTSGILVRRQVPYVQFSQGLAPGIYIVDGKKVMIGR